MTNLVGAILMIFTPSIDGVDLADRPSGTAESMVIRGRIKGIIRAPRSKDARADLANSWERLVMATIAK